MSCTTTPGNRAMLILARSQAENLSGTRVSESAVQKAFHHLKKEGKNLDLDSTLPDSTLISEWFSQQEDYARGIMPVGRSREAALRNLSDADAQWCKDEASISGDTFHAWRFVGDYAGYTAGRKKIENPATVAFDCDGVLYSFNNTLRAWLLTRGWLAENLPDPSVYSLEEAWGLTNADLLKEMPVAVRAGELWNTGDSLPDGVGVARELGLAGHTIMVNTARKIEGIEKEATVATLTWLRQEGVHPDILHLADPDDADDKMSVPFDVLFDDHPKNVKQAIDAGRKAYLIDRPWNTGVEGIPRISFSEAVTVVAELNK